MSREILPGIPDDGSEESERVKRLSARKRPIVTGGRPYNKWDEERTTEPDPPFPLTDQQAEAIAAWRKQNGPIAHQAELDLFAPVIAARIEVMERWKRAGCPGLGMHESTGWRGIDPRIEVEGWKVGDPFGDSLIFMSNGEIAQSGNVCTDEEWVRIMTHQSRIENSALDHNYDRATELFSYGPKYLAETYGEVIPDDYDWPAAFDVELANLLRDLESSCLSLRRQIEQLELPSA